MFVTMDPNEKCCRPTSMMRWCTTKRKETMNKSQRIRFSFLIVLEFVHRRTGTDVPWEAHIALVQNDRRKNLFFYYSSSAFEFVGECNRVQHTHTRTQRKQSAKYERNEFGLFSWNKSAATAKCNWFPFHKQCGDRTYHPWSKWLTRAHHRVAFTLRLFRKRLSPPTTNLVPSEMRLNGLRTQNGKSNYHCNVRRLHSLQCKNGNKKKICLFLFRLTVTIRMNAE